MSAYNRFENTLAMWHKRAPHLSPSYLNWLVTHSWRLDILGAMMSVYSTFVLIPLLVTTLALTPSVNIIGPDVPYDHDSLGLAWVALLLTMIIFFVTAIMLTFAAKPVKDRLKKGWDLMFRAYLLNVLLGIITTVLVPSLFELAVVVFITLGAGYLLLEVRSEFSAVPKKNAKVKVRA